MKKKLFSLTACLLCLFPLAACGSTTAQIVMIPDVGGIADGTFNQNAWEGLRLNAGVHGKSYNYYQPTSNDDEAFLLAIQKGVENGAEVIVLSGSSFSFVVEQAQARYPKVGFILLDALAAAPLANNTVSLRFAEEQAGYLAGYAAVADGYRQLGFLGGSPVPGVTGYGFGFVQGAAAAAKELDEEVQLRYAYNGQFVENDEAYDMATSWYATGTEIIFACGGGMNRSVFSAAEESGGKTIGADSDQQSESSTVVTSAIKALGTATGQMVEKFYAGQFPGEQNLVLDATEGAIGLAMDNNRFTTFSQKDYDTLLARLRDGEIEVLRKDEEISPVVALPALPRQLKLEYLTQP